MEGAWADAQKPQGGNEVGGKPGVWFPRSKRRKVFLGGINGIRCSIGPNDIRMRIDRLM